MCRMFSLYGDYRNDVDDLLNSLREVSRRDPLRNDEEGHPISHNDGWGYIELNSKYVDYKRYKSPIFKTKLPEFREQGFLMVHARKAATGEPLGLLNSHPHHKSTPEYDLYLCHNGSYDKEKIAALLGESNIRNQTDSEFFLSYIASRNGSIEEKIRNAIDATVEKELLKTTNNIMLLSVDKDTEKVNLYYYSDSRNPSEYTTLYYAETKKWKGVFSSSITLSKFFPKKLKIKKVPMRTLFELR